METPAVEKANEKTLTPAEKMLRVQSEEVRVYEELSDELRRRVYWT